jgi:hypothetical protein
MQQRSTKRGVARFAYATRPLPGRGLRWPISGQVPTRARSPGTDLGSRSTRCGHLMRPTPRFFGALERDQPGARYATGQHDAIAGSPPAWRFRFDRRSDVPPIEAARSNFGGACVARTIDGCDAVTVANDVAPEAAKDSEKRLKTERSAHIRLNAVERLPASRQAVLIRDLV